MITAIVQFKLPAGTSPAQAAELFKASAPNYRGVPGLIRKYYLLGDDGTGGGAYLWESRAAADALYTEEWRAMIAERFGAEPKITFYETPVVVDNTADEVITAAAE